MTTTATSIYIYTYVLLGRACSICELCVIHTSMVRGGLNTLIMPSSLIKSQFEPPQEGEELAVTIETDNCTIDDIIIVSVYVSVAIIVCSQAY